MEIKTKRHLIIFWLSIACLLMLGFLVCLIYLSIRSAQNSATLEMNIAANARQKEHLYAIKQGLRSGQADLEQVKNYLLRPEDGALLIENIEALAKTAGVSYEINQADDKNGLAFDLTAQGNFSAVFQFAQLLENLPYRVVVNHISLTKNSDKNKTWTANISIRALTNGQ